MWFNFFKLSVRRIVRDAGFSAINIGGLAIGLTAFILILEYIDFETNYDQSDISENVFRVQNNYIRHGELIYNTAATFPGVGPNMAEYFPQVESYGRIYPWSKLVKCSIVLPDSGPDNKVFIEENVAYADPSILNLLSIKMISGNPGTALNEPGLVIISESLATKYFANGDPVGQLFALEDSHVGSVELEVSGVFEDTPENSHANLDVLISYKTLYLRVEYRGDPAEISYEEDMGDYHFYTYILVNQPSDISRITEQMPDFLDRYKPRYMEVNKQGERMRTNQFTFTNLEDIHLKSDLQFEFGVNNKEEKVGFLGVTAVFILILAWVNYINLYTSKSVERAKEVGIRKVVGSSKRVLVLQFLIESFLINLFAFILAMTVIQVVQPFFNELTGRSLSLWQIEPLRLTAIMGTILILGSLISGFYPSWILSNYKPSTVLKGKFEAYGAGAILKRALVIFQFVVSTGLMACMLGVISQMNYMREVEIGFDIDRIVVIEKPAVPDETMGKASEKFKSDLLRLSMVEEVGGSDNIPGIGIVRGLAVSRTPGAEEEVRAIEELAVDHRFVRTYGFELVAGREFLAKDGQDTTFSIILNESATTELGYANPQEAIDDQVFLFTRRPARIVGVVKDYHHESLHHPVDPMFYWLTPGVDNFISVKLGGNDILGSVESLKSVYNDNYPNSPFEYFFLDSKFGEQYQEDDNFQRVFNLFSILTMIISCLGLFGLTMYSASKRIKEMGLRKVLGAGEIQIFNLMSREFFLLITLSSILMMPLSYIWLDSWLEGFAYKTQLGIMVFAAPLLFTLAIAFLTILGQLWKIVNVNPAQVLRYE